MQIREKQVPYWRNGFRDDTHTPMSEVQQLLKVYGDMYLAAFGESAPIEYARDGKIAKTLLARYKFASLAEWLRAYFASQDDFIRSGGFTFPQFQFNLSKLITATQTEGISRKSLASMRGIYGEPPVRTPIRDAVAFLSVEFRTEVDSPQRRAFERTLDELKEQPEILLRGAQVLVDEAANGRQFYPMPMAHDLKGACAKVIEVLRVEAFVKATAGCEHPSYMEELTLENGSSAFQRCSCYRRGKLAMDAVVKPLALPEWTEPSTFTAPTVGNSEEVA
jgi:hypothetical protein